MDVGVPLLYGLALALYLLAAASLARPLLQRRTKESRAASVLVVVAAAVHVGAVATYAAVNGELPLVGLAPSLSMLAFLIAAFLLAAGVFREGGALGVVLLPLVAALLGVALLIGIEPAGEPQAYRGLWFTLHVVLAFIGYAGLAGAFAAGLLYLVQFRALKEKRFGRMFRFSPALDTLDRLGWKALAVGFPGLTLGLLLGWGLMRRFPETSPVQSQIIWGVLTWIIFVVALGSRLGGAGGDRRGALASVLGFLVVVLSYVILRLAVAEGRAFL